MDIANLTEAENILISNSNNEEIIKKISDYMDQWRFESEDFESINTDVKKMVYSITLVFYSESHLKCDKIQMALHCLVYNMISDDLMKIIKENNDNKDKCLFEKLRSLSKMNITMAQLGSKIDYATKCPAAVVELSILNNYKSPLEKLNCLCSTYDLLYAHLKTVIVSKISKYSDIDNEIPIINYDEVIPALMVVIINSKLMYFYSNLEYIRLFCDFGEEKIKNLIFNCFMNTINKLVEIDVKSLEKSECEKLESSLDFSEVVNFTMKQEHSSLDKNSSFLNEEKKKICDQLTCISGNL